MKNLIIVFFFMQLLSFQLDAQDKIYKKNGEIIHTKVLKLDRTFVRYDSRFGTERLSTHLVDYIIFENGDTTYMPKAYANYRNSIKLSLVFPAFEYEHCIGRSQFSFALQAGLGVSFEDYMDGTGDFLAGPMFKLYFQKKNLLRGPYMGVGAKVSFVYLGWEEPVDLVLRPVMEFGCKINLNDRFFLDPSVQIGYSTFSSLGLIVAGYRF